jgi:hypothetical protein
VKGRANGHTFHEIAEGNGPVNALDHALRKAIGSRYPALEHVHLGAQRLEALLVADAEAVLLVDDDEPEAREDEPVLGQLWGAVLKFKGNLF